MGALSLLPSKLKIVVFVFLGIVLFYIVGLIGAAVCNFMWMDWVEFFKYLDGNLHRNYALLSNVLVVSLHFALLLHMQLH